MKLEIEKRYAPTLGRIQFFVFEDGGFIDLFDTREEAENKCEALLKSAHIIPERWEYTSKANDITMDAKLKIAGEI